MKYLALLAAVALIYALSSRFLQVAPVAPVTIQDPTALASDIPSTPEPAPRASDPLKRPLDRTKEVLGQVKARNGAGEF